MENFLEKDISIQKLELWDESPRLRRKCVGMDEWDILQYYLRNESRFRIMELTKDIHRDLK